MDLTFEIPNVVCRCGRLLFSWPDVVKHWEQHRAELASLRLYQKMFDDIGRASTKKEIA